MTACWCGSTSDILWHENRPLCPEHLPSVYPKASEAEKDVIRAATRMGGQFPETWSPSEYWQLKQVKTGERFR